MAKKSIIPIGGGYYAFIRIWRKLFRSYIDTAKADGRKCGAIDIVNFLNFSKPSVSIMLKKLKDSGYISIDKNSHIQLTIQGKNVAEKIYERHTYLTDFLIKIGVDSSTAEEDACKIEHDLSDKSFQAIKQLIDKL